MEDKVAILWDIENVTPSANSQFLEGLKEYTEHLGKLTVCRVYGDWTKGYLGRLSRQLSENGFELIHIPVARKNSADISLITNAVELIYQYPHITKIVLITGDADFRPLLYTLRRNGKSVHIICNSSNASEELLSPGRFLQGLPGDHPWRGSRRSGRCSRGNGGFGAQSGEPEKRYVERVPMSGSKEDPKAGS